MKRSLLVAVVAGIAAALIVAGTALSQSRSTSKLVGTVGPGYTIKLTKNGARVKTLKPGKYTFAVTDKAAIHDFTLEQEKGGKFEKHLTGVGFTGKKTVTVTLKRGKWKYYCSIHEPEMFGFFTVK
jgi:plastocyanin